jgi:alkyl hydroperoxide reductase subunit F
MEKTDIFDVAIVGYGPAGVTAGIYAARKKLRVLLIGELSGGEVRNSGEIENWPGDGATTGNELADKLATHLRSHSEEVTVVEKKVSKIVKNGDVFSIESDNQSWQSKTVIYATGRHPRMLNVPGEADMRNRGVSYCATCDAPIFSGKKVAVVGGGNTAAEAVIMLQKIASEIYVVQLLESLTADPVLIENFVSDEKVKIIYNAQTTAIEGDVMVNRLRFLDTKTKEEKALDVDGIFVLIGAVPNTQPVKDLLPLDKMGAIPADRYGVTSLPGFFAAGDVTDIRDAQIVVAAGHGCSAALSAGDYIARMGR